MNIQDIIRRVASRTLIARDYFEIGDPILYGKYKNGRGIIVGWGKDHKGNPTVIIEPVPKGRKQNKEIGLFKIWKNPPPAVAQQIKEQAQALLKQGCIIVGKEFNDEICLFKNRDRGYDAESEVVHLEHDGVEMSFIFDPKTGYLEGVNEHGIGVVNTALAVLHDEMEGKSDKGKKDKGKGKGPMKSQDGPKIFKALLTDNLKDALDVLITAGGGIKGHTFVSDGKTLVSIECSRTHPARVTRLDPERVNTRTNHGVSYPDAGYTHGDDYVSSVIRRWETQKRLQIVRHPEDIGPALLKPIHDKHSPFNPVRDTESMRTTSQLLINTTNPRMFLYLIPGHGELTRVRNMLPGKRDPKIPVRVIHYEATNAVEDGKVLEKDQQDHQDPPSPELQAVRQVLARYKSKKKVKTQDGDEMTVYEYSDRQIANRNRDKAKRIEKLRKSVDDLRTQVDKDLKSKDEKIRAVALAVALMDHTFERVGNEGSAKEGHFGVTTWEVQHVKINGKKATIKYVGKSGVDQIKTVTDAKILSALKAAMKDKSKSDCVVDATASNVNEYLAPFDISAKDIRGFHANQEMKDQLKKIRSGKLPIDKKEREELLKTEFKKALEATAKAVGHEPSTLKSQYLVPGLEDDYMKDGTINESHAKRGGRPEKDRAEKDDEQVQDMFHPLPKKKPPRHDLHDNLTLQDRDKDLEGMDRDDAGDEDLQVDVRRTASRVAFRWLALPLNPSGVRVAMMVEAKPKADNRGKHWESPNNPGVWVGQNRDGQTRSFKDQNAAKAFSRGDKPEKEKSKKQGPLGEKEKGKGKGNKAPEEGSRSEDVPEEPPPSAPRTPSTPRRKHRRTKPKTEEPKTEEPKTEEPKPDSETEDSETPPKKPSSPKKPTPESQREELEGKRDELEKRVDALQKQLDDNKDAEGGRLLEDERPKVEKELAKARGELGKLNEDIAREQASEEENARTESVAQELYDAEKKENPGTRKTKQDFVAKAREQVQGEIQKEQAKQKSDQEIAKAKRTIEDLIGPGSSLDDSVQEAMSAALGSLDEAGAAEFAAALKDHLETLVTVTSGSSPRGREIANRAAKFEGYDGITDPKELAKRVAEAAYARNVVANPKILGGTPISNADRTQEELTARAMEATTHYRDMEHSLRESAAQTLVDELASIDPKSNRAKEIGHILTGIALAAALHGQSVPGRPQPSEKAVRLIQAMDRQGNLEHMLRPVEDIVSPSGRQAIAEALGDMDNADLMDHVTGGDSSHPYSGFSELLESENISPAEKQMLRDVLIGGLTDEMSYLDRAAREITGEEDPKKRAQLIRKSQGSKESRKFVADVVEAAKSEIGLKSLFPELETGVEGNEEEENTSLVDAMRSTMVENFLQDNSDSVEGHLTSPSVAVLREVATSRSTSAMESEIDPHPEAFWGSQRVKKTAFIFQYFGYTRPQISEGPFCAPVRCDSLKSTLFPELESPQSPPPNRSQNPMPNLTKKGARSVTADLDRLATLFQQDYAALGLPQDVAQDMALRCDMLSDRIESHAGLRPRTAQMDPPANFTEEDVLPNEFNPAEIGEEQSQALLRNEDEPYMDVFKQDEFDQLRQVQQDGMFSNAKSAAALLEKMARALAEKGDTRFSAQKKSEVTSSSDASELVKLADSLDRLGNLEANITKFREAAGLGHWTDFQAEEHIRQLTELERQLADAEAEIEALAGEVLKRKANLDKEHKKRIEQLKKELPVTLAGQGKVIIEVRQALIRYAKVAEKKRPGVMQMLGDPSRDIGAPVEERGGELLQRVQAQLGDVIAAQVAEIYDTVMEEITVLTPTIRGLEYELREKNASDMKTASEEDQQKQAGVMTLLVKFRDWLVGGMDKMKRLFGMGTRRIDNAANKIEVALNQADDALEAVYKTAGEIPEAFKENIQKMKDKAKDKEDKEDSKSEDKEDKSEDKDKDNEDKKASHGYLLSA